MILALDTSTDTMSIALFSEGNVIGEYISTQKKNHSVRLMPAIKRLMEECEIQPQNLKKIAVAQGPGSYTGLRIGVTIAKTLAWGLNIPLVGISSLKVLAANGVYFKGKIVPCMDARRENVYAGIYRWHDRKLELLFEERHIAFSDLIQRFIGTRENVLFIGSNMEDFHKSVQGKLGEFAHFTENHMSYARAGALAALAVNEEGTPAHDFVPKYLKLAEAESKWLNSRGKK